MAPARQLAIGPLIGVLGAILLAVSLFVDWYGGATAWTVFEALDLLLAVVAVAALLAFADRLGLLPPSGASRASGLALPLAILALVVVVSQLIHDPPTVPGFDPDTGAWLALTGTALLLAGALLSVARISVALDLDGREAEAAGAPRRPAAPGASPGGAPPGQPRSPRGGAADPGSSPLGQPARPAADPESPTVARPGEPRAPGSTPAEPRPPGSAPPA